MSNIDLGAIWNALKNVFLIGVTFYKALWELLVRLWDVLAVVFKFVSGLTN